MDPDGNDIEETPLLSDSIAVMGAVRVSGGIAVDSNGIIAFYAKVELGVGAGTSVGLSKLFTGNLRLQMKLIEDVCNYYSKLQCGLDISDDIINLPDDTGAGNIEKEFYFKYETEKDWAQAPTESAIFFGFQTDENGHYSLDAPALIASAYVRSFTVYVKICDACDIEYNIDKLYNRIQEMLGIEQN